MQRTAAKRRWGILSDHLTKKVRSTDTNVITSTFNTYGLHELEQIGQDETGTWYRLKWKDKDWPIIEVRLIDKFRFDVMDLSGFNNTGNIRIVCFFNKNYFTIINFVFSGLQKNV